MPEGGVRPRLKPPRPTIQFTCPDPDGGSSIDVRITVEYQTPEGVSYNWESRTHIEDDPQDPDAKSNPSKDPGDWMPQGTTTEPAKTAPESLTWITITVSAGFVTTTAQPISGAQFVTGAQLAEILSAMGYNLSSLGLASLAESKGLFCASSRTIANGGHRSNTAITQTTSALPDSQSKQGEDGKTDVTSEDGVTVTTASDEAGDNSGSDGSSSTDGGLSGSGEGVGGSNFSGAAENDFGDPSSPGGWSGESSTSSSSHTSSDSGDWSAAGGNTASVDVTDQMSGW